MSKDAPPATGEPSDAPASAPGDRATDDAAGADEEAGAAAPKGLWSLMKSGPATGAESSAPPKADTPESTRKAARKPVSLDDLDDEEIEELPPRATPPADANDEAVAEDEDVAEDDLADDDRDADDAAEEAEETESAPAIETSRSRGAMLSLLLGLAAVPTTLLSLFPQFWLRIPTTVLGFSALLIGYLALGEIRRSRGKQTGNLLAITGMLAGTIAMFLSPFLVTQYGEKFRRDLAIRETGARLEEVGGALLAYENEHKEFPSGSRHIINKDGDDVALHGWHAMLLPYLGEDAAEIYGAIDFEQPFSAEVNRPAMQRDVPLFFASGADRSKLSNGFAVTHFVALGGQRDVEGVGRANIGIFGRNSHITRNQVEDGLEHTLVAGEVAYDFPAWGEPNVYRQIGKGLNKDRHGFGNARRDGAMFLKADGSVQFFSNATDVNLLLKLSTRDGREQLPDGY